VKRGRRLRPRSAKTTALYRIRRPLVARLIAERPICERCKAARSQDVHELKSRARGGSIVSVPNLVCLCRKCHDTVTGGGDVRFQLHSWEDDQWTA
jgi:5-methylcytosine-specific restriction endonuclease McrA